MTVIIKCQHSGIEFEASNKRTKQHPLVAEFKNEVASRRGDYRLGKEALEKASEIGGYQTIEQYMGLVQSIYDGSYEQKRQAELAKIQRDKELEEKRQQAQVEREKLNRFLREHSYTWRKTYADPAYGAGWGEDDREVWRLFSPDGRIVSVAEAKDEIERGSEVVLAEAEAKEQAKLEAKAQQASAIDDLNDARAKAIAGMTETEAFDLKGFSQVYDTGKYKENNFSVRRVIYSGTINGINCTAIETVMFDGDSYRYWSADPDEAGLSAKTQKSMLNDFFS